MSTAENDSALAEAELILGNSNPRFSGVTSTMLQVLNVQKELIPLVVLGRHHLPAGVRVVGFWQAARLYWRPLRDGRWRIFHARRNNEMIQALLLRYVFRAKIKIVFTSTAQRHKTWITRWLMRHMDGLLSTCTAAARYMPEPPDLLIPHGIDHQLYYPADDRAAVWRQLALPGRYGIGIFGRVRHQKGVDLLVDAAIIVLPRYPEFVVVVVGEITADQQEFVRSQKEKLREVGLEDRVVFTGELPFEQVPVYFRAMSVITALSRNEGFGLTVLEAMSSGIPVIATEAGAWPDIVDNGNDGFLIPTDDVRALAARLATLMDDEAQRYRMGNKGREKVLANYTIEREAKTLLDYYRTFG